VTRGKRELFRISIVREGTVRRGSDVAACTVTELTAQGIGLCTDLRASCGEQLEVTFALADRSPIRCHMLVSHTCPPRLGGRIISISSTHLKQLARFIEQHTAIALAAC